MKKKIALMATSLVLVAALAVGGTLAYLTSQDEVVNTFTVGNVAITLDEARVNPDGTPVADAARVKANEYKLIPGHNYTKDPTIHVTTGSEPCYLFVKVENGISNIEKTDVTIASQMTTNGWTALSDGSNIYYYSSIVDASETAVDKVVFDSFTIAGDAAVASYSTAQVKITAYAVQADGFNNAADAWAAASFS